MSFIQVSLDGHGLHPDERRRIVNVQHIRYVEPGLSGGSVLKFPDSVTGWRIEESYEDISRQLLTAVEPPF